MKDPHFFPNSMQKERALTLYKECESLLQKKCTFASYEQALVLLNRSVFLHEKSKYLAARGEVYVRMGDLKSGIANLKRACSLRKEKTVTKFHRRLGELLDLQAMIYLQNRNYWSAIYCLDDAIGLDPPQQRYYFHRGMVYSELGDVEQAFKDLDKAKDMVPYVNIVRGRIFVEKMNNVSLGKVELDAVYEEYQIMDCVKEFRRLIMAKGNEIKINASKALINEEYENAITLFDDSIHLYPQDPELYLKRAICLRRLKNFPGAIKDLFHTIELSQGVHKRSEELLAETLYDIAMEMTDRIKSIKFFDEAIKWNSKVSTYFLSRGDTYYHLQKFNEALNDYKIVESMTGGDHAIATRIASLRNEFGKLLYQEKQYVMAEKELTDSIRIFNQNPIVYLNRSKVRFKLKKSQEAIEDIVTAYILDKDNKEAQKLVRMYVPKAAQSPHLYETIVKKRLMLQSEVQSENLSPIASPNGSTRPSTSVSSRRTSRAMSSKTFFTPRKSESHVIVSPQEVSHTFVQNHQRPRTAPIQRSHNQRPKSSRNQRPKSSHIRPKSSRNPRPKSSRNYRRKSSQNLCGSHTLHQITEFGGTKIWTTSEGGSSFTKKNRRPKTAGPFRNRTQTDKELANLIKEKQQNQRDSLIAIEILRKAPLNVGEKLTQPPEYQESTTTRWDSVNNIYKKRYQKVMLKAGMEKN